MPPALTIALPIEDRRRARDFYRDGLGFEPIGALADDGIPEPLQLARGDVRIMLVPTGGFAWAIGTRTMRSAEQVGCLLTIGVATDAEVDEVASRAEAAGATVVVAPSRQPWGMYATTFTDPDGNLWMVTSDPA